MPPTEYHTAGITPGPFTWMRPVTAKHPNWAEAGLSASLLWAAKTLIGLANKEGNTNHCGYQRTQVSYLGGTAHELAHAFGLDHPPGCDDGLPTCDWDALMHLGYNNYPDTYFTEMDIERLDRNRFHPGIRDESVVAGGELWGL